MIRQHPGGPAADCLSDEETLFRTTYATMLRQPLPAGVGVWTRRAVRPAFDP